VLLLLAAAFWWTGWPQGRSPVAELGAASFFVYWIHVEMVYGLATRPLHRNLTFEQAVVATGVFSLLLFALVRLKHRLGGVRATPRSEEALSPLG
jgi:cytosine/uracil/thiamine/allantoin permease